MILYFIASGDALCGDNADLFVWANAPLDAVILWRAHFELDSSTQPDRVWVVPTSVPCQALVVGWEHMEKIPDDLLYRH
jgi:hypothetical protein